MLRLRGTQPVAWRSPPLLPQVDGSERARGANDPAQSPETYVGNGRERVYRGDRVQQSEVRSRRVVSGKDHGEAQLCPGLHRPSVGRIGWRVRGSLVPRERGAIPDRCLGANTERTYGSPFTGVGYEGAWAQEAFWRNVINTSFVCIFVVCTSLTIGTLGGYALSRSGYKYVFWLLIIALIFRAIPPE